MYVSMFWDLAKLFVRYFNWSLGYQFMEGDCMIKMFCGIILITSAPLFALTSRVQFAHAEMGLKEGIEHLDPTFKTKLSELSSALDDAGLRIEYGLHRVSPQGQYLRYWAWKIAKEGYRKSKYPPPPPFPGCDIDWFWISPDPHYHVSTAERLEVPSYVGAAMDMVKYFRMAQKPELTSKISEGKAITFVLLEKGKASGFSDPKSIKGKDGKIYVIPHGVHLPGVRENETLCALYATYGLYPVKNKNFEDTCEMWSDDGNP